MSDADPPQRRMPLPPFYDDLAAGLNNVWGLLAQGAVDRRSAFHTPVVATVSVDGEPQQRVMVLRAADRESRRLRFHTDIRTGKVEQVMAQPRVSVLGYDSGRKLQVRLSGEARIGVEDPETEAAWGRTTLHGRRCYLGPLAPGISSSRPTSGLPAALEGRQPGPQESEAGRAVFSTLQITLDRIEWLYLADTGHRRAAHTWLDGAWASQWLVP